MKLKNIHYFLFVFIAFCQVLLSCKNPIDITARKYNKGFYVNFPSHWEKLKSVDKEPPPGNSTLPSDLTASLSKTRTDYNKVRLPSHSILKLSPLKLQEDYATYKLSSTVNIAPQPIDTGKKQIELFAKLSAASYLGTLVFSALAPAISNLNLPLLIDPGLMLAFLGGLSFFAGMVFAFITWHRYKKYPDKYKGKVLAALEVTVAYIYIGFLLLILFLLFLLSASGGLH